jgi:hypothetical protein
MWGKRKDTRFLDRSLFLTSHQSNIPEHTFNCRNYQLIVDRLVAICRELVVGYPWGEYPGMGMLASIVAFDPSFRKSPGNDTLGSRLKPYWSRIYLSSWENGPDRVQLWGSPGKFGREGSISALSKGTIINFQARSKTNNFEGSSRELALRTEPQFTPPILTAWTIRTSVPPTWWALSFFNMMLERSRLQIRVSTVEASLDILLWVK